MYKKVGNLKRGFITQWFIGVLRHLNHGKNRGVFEKDVWGGLWFLSGKNSEYSGGSYEFMVQI